MDRKGFGTEKILYTIFVIALGMMLLAFIPVALTGPVLKTYSQENAELTTYLVASAINALSTEERGTIDITLNGQWNIIVYEESGGRKVLVLTHVDESTQTATLSAKTPVMGNVSETSDEFPLYYVSRLRLEKEPGAAVEVTKI